MTEPQIVHAMAAHKQGSSSHSEAFRHLVQHPSWHVPSRIAADGSSGLWMFPGSAGEWWVCAFSSKQAMDAYAQANKLTIGDNFFVTAGGSLARNIPGGARGVGLDLASPHGMALYAQDLPLLAEFGQAVRVEEILQGNSKRDNQFELLRNYPGYRFCWQGSQLMMAPDNQGRRLAAVFTAEDTYQAFRARHGASVPPHTKVDGKTLFEQLRIAPIDGIVFNCAGPIPPKAVAHAFSDATLKGVDRPASQPANSAPVEQPGGPISIGSLKPDAAKPDTAKPDPAKPDPASIASASSAVIHDQLATAAPVSRAALNSAVISDYQPHILRQDHPSLTASVLTRPLAPPTDPTHPIVSPMVCLAAETANGHHLATAKTLGTRSFDELVDQGARMLAEKQSPRLEVVGDPPRVASLHGEHATEALLVPSALKVLHQKLDSKVLLVAIPVRGVVLACSMQNGAAVVRLANSADKVFRASGDQGLFAQPMMVQDGKVMGRARVELEADEAEPDDADGTTQPLRARSLAECSVYLNLRNYPVQGRKQSITTEEADVVVQYECRNEGAATRTFTFRISKADMAATSGDGPIQYSAGDTPSELIDAGQFFSFAEGFAKQTPASLDGLDRDEGIVALNVIERAAAFMDEVIKFIPAGQETMPDDAFFTAMGKRARDEQPAGRWSRTRLSAIAGAYRKLADSFRNHAHQRGWLYG